MSMKRSIKRNVVKNAMKRDGLIQVCKPVSNGNSEKKHSVFSRTWKTYSAN